MTVADSALARSLSIVRACGGRAFGLELEGSFEAPGLLDGTVSDGARRTTIELVRAREIHHACPSREALRLTELRDADGAVRLTIDEHAESGYHLHSTTFGCYLVSRDGCRVRCAPSRIARWRWQSFLVGQLLPAAAVLRGLEILHASVVVIAGQAVALVGPSQAGKSSVAINLVRRGATFLTDDVVALEPFGERVLAHPGPALTSVRHEEAAAIGPAALRRLGQIIGRDDHEIRLRLRGAPAPAPLALVYAIDRSGSGQRPTFAPLDHPRVLFANRFSSYIQSPERLTRQLDVYARAACCAATFRLGVPATGVDAAAVAVAVHAHALSVLERSRDEA